MLTQRLSRLRARLDGLREGKLVSQGLVERARGLFDAEGPGSAEVLLELDRDLDKVGVHTAADAQLLKELGVQTGRAGALASGLASRAEGALQEVEALVRRAERALASGQPASTGRELQEHYLRLARVVKVAELFAAPKGPVAFEIYEREAFPREAPVSARLAIAEFWAQRARGAVSDLVQKRRDLDAAHELLLRLGGEGDRDRARRLRLEVTAAKERSRAVPAVRSLEDLLRHLRLSARKDPAGAYRSLRALYERAVEAGDGPVAGAAHAAAQALLPQRESVKELVERAEGPGASWSLGVSPLTSGEGADPLAELAFDLSEERLALFELSEGCARFFDVEDALSKEVVEAETAQARPRQRRVPYPTQNMSLEFTNSLDELPNLLISHPRTLLYDLASNRQPLRTYLEVEPPPRPKRIRQTAVRSYVCDASGSMHGARARFRDAIVIAELNNLRLKAGRGLPYDPLYFSFFNDSSTELARVDSAAEATRQIEKLFSHSPASGQTDISMALMAAFDSIRAAQGRDPYLARATVVLVTDGEDRVDLELIRATRAPIGSLDIALSFISLGEENPDLKALVLEQRAAGGRAFYHHLSDREIGLARTEFDSSFRTLLPKEVPATASALEALLPHLEALQAVAEGRAVEAPVRPEGSFDALFPPRPPAPSRPEASADRAKVAELLEAICEAASLAPADVRGAEAVTLLHHLLALYGWAPARYLGAVVADPPIQEALDRLRLLCRPFG